MLATNMSEAGTPEEKLRWAFKMYDKDGSGNKLGSYGANYKLQLNRKHLNTTERPLVSGTIDLKEMIEIVGNLYELEGLSKVGNKQYPVRKDSNSNMSSILFFSILILIFFS